MLLQSSWRHTEGGHPGEVKYIWTPLTWRISTITSKADYWSTKRVKSIQTACNFFTVLSYYLCYDTLTLILFLFELTLRVYAFLTATFVHESSYALRLGTHVVTSLSYDFSFKLHFSPSFKHTINYIVNTHQMCTKSTLLLYLISAIYP